MTTTILGIAGSWRRASTNKGLLSVVSAVLPADTTLQLADISELPLYNWDVEQESGYPESVQRFRAQIRRLIAALVAEAKPRLA